MGHCIITRRGGGADGLERLAAVKNWSTFNTGEHSPSWFDGSTATIPAGKFCVIIFGETHTNNASIGNLILVIDNRQVLANISVQSPYSVSIASGGKITLTNKTSFAVCATIGTI